MEFLTINELYESSGPSTPATRIQRPTDGDHWRAPNNIFGATITVEVSEERFEYDYNYKTEFQIWKENKVFERQFFSMSKPPLDSNTVGTKTSNAKTSSLAMVPGGTYTCAVG